MRRQWFAAVLLLFVLGAAAGRAQVPIYFNVIHCDPHFASEADWGALEDLVAAADARGIVLTIQFNPAWSGVISSEPSRAGDILGWVAEGHEIGGHHHVLSHPGAWDGYSNQPAATGSAGYLGSMQDWLAALTAMLPPAADVLTVSSKDYDFPAGVEFQTGGSGSTPSPSDAASVPTLKSLNGAPVWQIDHAALIAGGVWQTDPMKAAFNATSADQVFGVAFHPHDFYPGDHENVDDWFDFLVSVDPDQSHSQTAGAILEAHRQSLQTAVPGASMGALSVTSILLLCLAFRALR